MGRGRGWGVGPHWETERGLCGGRDLPDCPLSVCVCVCASVHPLITVGWLVSVTKRQDLTNPCALDISLVWFLLSGEAIKTGSQGCRQQQPRGKDLCLPGMWIQ